MQSFSIKLINVIGIFVGAVVSIAGNNETDNKIKYDGSHNNI